MLTAQLTFLFTDLENSTGLWQQAPVAMHSALARHDAIIQEAVTSHNGSVVKTTGDGVHAAFGLAPDAILAAVSMQQAVGREKWPVETGPLRIRIGLHTGVSQERAGDFYGSAVNTAARVMALGHGGQVLLSEVTVLLVRGQLPAEISFTDLGLQWLKGLAQPERIYQLVHPSLAKEFPPLNSLSVAKHNLPAEVAPLVGRDREIDELAQLLTDPGHSLVTIVAPGGTGKSSLALGLGRRLVELFEHGVYFVELAPVSDSESIIPAIAEAVDYRFQQNGRSQEQQILDFVANKEMLLILDNYEHLLEGADIALELLHAAARLKIVVTSRQRLQLPGETLYTLHGLSRPSEGASDAAQYAAVQLFEQAARRTRPEFLLSPADSQAVGLICRLVQGMPLGILLAAAWISVLSPAEIAEEIQRGLDFLEAEGHELPERQHSVRAVFEQSWGMMSDTERNLFQKASVFRGGFTRAAGQEVAGAGLRELQSLLNKALVERSADQGRYVVHELLRQFGQEKLQQSGLDRQVRDAHFRYYLAYLASQTDRLKGAEQLPAIKAVEGDFDNIREAWHCAILERAYDDIARAIEAMYLVCLLRSRLEDGKALFREAQEGLAPAAGETPHPAWLAAGVRFYEATESRSALEKRLGESLALARARGDHKEQAFCLETLATIAHYVDQDPQQAIMYYEECAEIYRKVDEPYYLAQTLSKLGEAYQLIGRTDLTYQHVNEANELQRRIGDHIGESESLRALAMTSWQTGNYDTMFDYFHKMYAIQLQTGYLVGQATSITYLGLTSITNGHLDEGVDQVQTALDLAIDIADFSTQSWCYAILGFEAGVRSDIEAAGRYLESAQAIDPDPFRQTGAGNPFLQLHINLVKVLIAVGGGDFASAAEHLLQPLHLATMTDSQPYMAISLALATLIYGQNDRLERAAQLMSLVSQQPQAVTGWLKYYSSYVDLRVCLEQQLGPERLAASTRRGLDMELSSATEEVLRDIEARYALN